MQFDIDKDQIVSDKIYKNSKFKPGDKILFKRGEIWYEKLYVLSSGIKNNPIMFGSYGSGERPIISGSQCFSSKCGSEIIWEKVNDSMFKLKVESDVSVVTKNEKPLTFVSWEPNKDNFDKMIPDSSLFDYENKILYLWLNNDDSPNNYTIRGSVVDVVVKPINSEYFIIKDFEIVYAASTCVKPKNIKHAIFENLEIHNCGGLWDSDAEFYYGNGITITFNSEDVIIQNNTIYDIYDSAVSPQLFYESNLLLNNILIKNNIMYNAPHSVVEITNWADNSLMKNILVEDNKIYNNGNSFSEKYNLNKPHGGPGILITIGLDKRSKIQNVKIVNNEIFNSTLGGIAVGLNSGPVEITNNNIHDNKGSGIIIFDDKKPTITEVYIRNNSITNNADDILAFEELKVVVDNNNISNNGNLVLIQQVEKYSKTLS